MRIRKLLLIAGTAYQLFRFTVLFFLLVLAVHGTAAAGAGSIALAGSAPSLVVVVLLVQLAVHPLRRDTIAPLLTPLRLAAVLQVITAVTLGLRGLRAPLPMIPDLPGIIPFLAAIIAIADFAFLLFLLTYGKHVEEP